MLPAELPLLLRGVLEDPLHVPVPRCSPIRPLRPRRRGVVVVLLLVDQVRGEEELVLVVCRHLDVGAAVESRRCPYAAVQVEGPPGFFPSLFFSGDNKGPRS
jgi:hypothetical protein